MTDGAGRRAWPPAAIDRRQWRALVVTGLRHDLRRAGHLTGLGRNAAPWAGLLVLVLLQVLVGAILALPIWTRDDPWPGTVLHLTMLGLTVAAWLLLDGSALVLSPADHALVAPRPVHPATFRLARATTLVVFAGMLGAAQAAVPVAALWTAGGWQPARGTLAATAALSVTLTAAALVSLLHATAVKALPPRWHRLGLTGLQLAVTGLLYTLLVLLPGAVTRTLVLAPLADRAGWVRWLPSSWAASMVVGPVAWWKPLLAVTIPAAAWLLTMRVLTVEHVGALAGEGDRSDNERRSRRGRLSPAPGIARPETRVVARLARAQFRDDLRFRLAVLSIVPLTGVYLAVSAIEPPPAHGHPTLLYVAMLVFPALLRGAFTRSDAWRAAWILHAAPVRASRLVSGLERVVTGWFLLPYALAAWTVLAITLPGPWPATVSAVAVTLVARALLLVQLIADPALPFSVPPQAGAATRAVMLATVPAILIGQALPDVLVTATTSPPHAALGLATLAGLNLALARMLRASVDRRAGRAEFSG